MDDNPLVELHRSFSSYYKLDKFVRNEPAFKFITPVEYKTKPSPTSGETAKFVYVSISETLAKIVPELPKPDVQPSDGLIRDVKDGRVYKENPYFIKHPDAYTILLYSDAIEINNPLGAKKGVNKLVNIYWTIAEIPKHLRSKTENWFLALTVKESDLKSNRDAVYQPIVDDLLLLEKGITSSDGKVLRAGLVFHLGDNLESHGVGGFNPCFSSRDVCRVCHKQHRDLEACTGKRLLTFLYLHQGCESGSAFIFLPGSGSAFKIRIRIQCA